MLSAGPLVPGIVGQGSGPDVGHGISSFGFTAFWARSGNTTEA